MLARPKVLWIMMLTLFGVALSLPAQVMMLYGHGFDELGAVFHKLTSLNWLVFGGSILAGVLIFTASPWSRVIMPVLVGTVALNNFFVGYLATDYSFTTATMGTFAFALMFIPLYRQGVRELFVHPELRWWKSKSRRRLAVPIFVGGSRRVKLRSETFDISETGAFIPVEAFGLDLQEHISICLTLGTFQQIRCDARVVRRTSANGHYPAGVGIQFTNMDWWQRREIKRYLSRQI